MKGRNAILGAPVFEEVHGSLNARQTEYVAWQRGKSKLPQILDYYVVYVLISSIQQIHRRLP